jgi:hypothetical protein
LAFCEQHGFRVREGEKKEILADLEASFDSGALDVGTASEPIQEFEAEQPQDVSCPSCDTSIPAGTLVEGENSCPHCQGVFVIDMG